MITVTRATELDSADLLRWRNDEITRAASGASEPVSPSEHSAWFARVMSDDHRFLYVARQTGSNGPSANVGMCRFDLGSDHRAEVSINLNPEYRGKGIARLVLEEGIAAFRTEAGDGVALMATIAPTNVTSVRIFNSVGFTLSSTDGEFNYYTL